MIARMILTGLVALYLSSIPSLYSAGRTPTLQTTPARIQQPQSANSLKDLRIFLEEDFSTAQMLKRELTDWSGRMGIRIVFVGKDVEPYDLRILLTSGEGSDTGSCSSYCSCSSISTDISCSCTPHSSPCSVTITLHFVSALALAPDGKLQFTETGVGSAKISAITPLARKLAKRLFVLRYAKSTPAK